MCLTFQFYDKMQNLNQLSRAAKDVVVKTFSSFIGSALQMTNAQNFNVMGNVSRSGPTIKSRYILCNFSMTPNMLSKGSLLSSQNIFWEILKYEAAVFKHNTYKKCQHNLALLSSFPRIAHHRMPLKTPLNLAVWVFCGALFEED